MTGLRRNEQVALIDYKFLSDPSDADVLLEGLQLAVKTMENTIAFKDLGARLLREDIPACSTLKFKTEEYWRCFIRQTGETNWHPTGTCRLGSGLEDKHAVLDSKFRVLGIKNLRVVDASVMPFVPNSNIAAPTYMLGEKASDDILKAWTKK